jgi:hypothetical protein
MVSPGSEITSDKYDVTIDWGDTEITYENQNLPKPYFHRYTSAGTYQVTVTLKQVPYRCSDTKTFTSTFYILGGALKVNNKMGTVSVPSGSDATITLDLSGAYDLGSGDKAIRVVLKYGDGIADTFDRTDTSQLVTSKKWTGTGTYYVHATLEDLDQSPYGPGNLKTSSNVVIVQVT